MTDDTTPADEPKADAVHTDAPAPEVGQEEAVAAEQTPTPEPAPTAAPLEVMELDVTEPAPVTELIPALEPPAEPEPTPEPEPEQELALEATTETQTQVVPEGSPKAEPEPPTEPAPEPEPQPGKPAKPARKRATKAAQPAAAAAETAVAVADETAPGEAQPESKKKWYVVKVQSGREESIKAAIERKVKIEGLEEYFGEIMIPVEEEIVKKQVKVKDKKTGESTYQEKKVTKKKKKYHGYIFANVEFNDRILYLFRETSGVGGFVGVRGTPPTPDPMPEHEVQSMLTGVAGPKGAGGKKSVKVKLAYEKGDKVRIREGAFANNEGEVKAITEPKDPTDSPKVTVVVTIWGRPVDVELEYWQVDKA